MVQLRTYFFSLWLGLFLTTPAWADFEIENNCFSGNYQKTINTLYESIQKEVARRNDAGNFKTSCATARSYHSLCGSPLQGNKRYWYYNKNSHGSQFLANSEPLLKQRITEHVLRKIKDEGVIPTSNCPTCLEMEKDAHKNSELISKSFKNYPADSAAQEITASCEKNPDESESEKVSIVDACQMTALSSNENAKESTLSTATTTQHRNECLLAAMVKNQEALMVSLAMSYINDMTITAMHKHKEAFVKHNKRMAKEMAKKARSRSKSKNKRRIAAVYRNKAAYYFQQSTQDVNAWIDRQFQESHASHSAPKNHIPTDFGFLVLGGLFLGRRRKTNLPLLLITASTIFAFSCSESWVNPQVMVEPPRQPVTNADIPIDADRGAAAIANNETLYKQLEAVNGDGGDINPNRGLAAAKAAPRSNGNKPSYQPEKNIADIPSFQTASNSNQSGGSASNESSSAGSGFSENIGTTTINRKQADSVSLSDGVKEGLYSAGGAAAKAGGSGLSGAANAISGLFNSLTGGSKNGARSMGSKEVKFPSHRMHEQDQVWNDRTIIYGIPIGASIFKVVSKRYNRTTEKWAIQETRQSRSIASQPNQK